MFNFLKRGSGWSPGSEKVIISVAFFWRIIKGLRVELSVLPNW